MTHHELEPHYPPFNRDFILRSIVFSGDVESIRDLIWGNKQTDLAGLEITLEKEDVVRTAAQNAVTNAQNALSENELHKEWWLRRTPEEKQAVYQSAKNTLQNIPSRMLLFTPALHKQIRRFVPDNTAAVLLADKNTASEYSTPDYLQWQNSGTLNWYNDRDAVLKNIADNNPQLSPMGSTQAQRNTHTYFLHRHIVEHTFLSVTNTDSSTI